MGKLIVTVSMLMSAVFPAFSQSPNQTSSQPKCTLTLSQAPAIRGLRLGMNSEEVLTIFPESLDPFGNVHEVYEPKRSL